MNNLSSYLSLIAPLAIVIMLVVIGLLSRRLGQVTRRPPAYRWIFVSAGLMVGAIVLRFSMLINPSLMDEFTLVYDVILVASLSLAVIVIWQYWSWLFADRGTRRHE